MSDNFVHEVIETLRKRIDRSRQEQQEVEMNIKLDSTRRKEMVNSIIQYRAGIREAMLTIIKMQNQRKTESGNLSVIGQPSSPERQQKAS